MPCVYAGGVPGREKSKSMVSLRFQRGSSNETRAEEPANGALPGAVSTDPAIRLRSARTAQTRAEEPANGALPGAVSIDPPIPKSPRPKAPKHPSPERIFENRYIYVQAPMGHPKE